MEGIAEMSLEPKIHINMATIIPVDVRTQLDDYLTNRSSIDFLAKLPGFLQVDVSDYRQNFIYSFNIKIL